MKNKLAEAIDEHDSKKVEELLIAGEDPNIPLEIKSGGDIFTYRLLELAIDELPYGGERKVIDDLIKYGAKINPHHNDYELTPLHAAILNNDLELVKLLLSLGADPNVKMEGSGLCIQDAVIENDIELLKLLLEYGGRAKINDTGGYCGCTALCLAAQRLNIPIIQLLKENGASNNALDTDGDIALSYLPSVEEVDQKQWQEAYSLLKP